MTTPLRLSNPTPNSARAQKPSRYQYEPLTTETCVRLLQLDPASTGEGGKHAGLGGKLVVVDLRTMCKYEALSYVWGSTENHDYIVINGMRLQIRANLADALRGIRYKSLVRTVWIDAICINQDDVLERQQQVRYMAHIYRYASQVLVHLGGLKDVSLGSLRNLTGNEEECAAILARSKRAIRISRREKDAWVKLPWEIECLIDLSKNEWFHRVWTTQEIGLASKATVFLGGQTMSWTRFSKMFQICESEFTSHELRDMNFQPGNISLLKNFFLQPGGSFLDVLAQTHARGATNPRDRVFAILSHPSAQMLSGDGTVAEVNYGWSLSEVYRQTAIGVIQQTGNLDILSYVWQTMEERVTNQSWAPRWEYGNYTNLLIKAYRRPRASRDRNLNLTKCLKLTRNGPSGDQLCLRGWKVGTVEDTSQTFSKRELLSSSPSISHTRWLPIKLPRVIIDRYMKFRRNCFGRYGNSFLSVFGSALTANLLDPQYHDSNGVDQYRADLSAFSTAMLQRSYLRRDLMSLPRSYSKGSYHNFIKSAWYACHGRKLFSTDDKYLGLGPKLLELGDVIYVLHGGSVPYVLRPAGRHRYRLVGECYIEGLMDGQADDYWSQKNGQCPQWARKIREITLC